MAIEKKIEDIETQAEKEGWPYPKLFEALKDAGVISYDVFVASHTRSYHSKSTDWQVIEPLEVSLIVAQSFNEESIKKALARRRDRQANYGEFLKELGQAGVKEYSIDMHNRTATYKGDAGQEYVERIPR